MRLVLLLLSALFLAAGDASGPVIEGLQVSRDGGTILINFELKNALDEPTMERIQSGLPTEFRYLIRVQNPHRWWFDSGVDRVVLQVVTMYNAVTMEYLVNYKLDTALTSVPCNCSPASTVSSTW